MKFPISIVSIVVLMISLPSFAASQNSDFSTKEEFIEQLTPKPKIKMRSIQINGTGSVEADVPAPNVSMQVNFEFDSYQLTNAAKSRLQPLGEALMSEQLISYSFELAGHTDASGAAQYNQDLSGKRAISVGQYLYDTYGVDPSRLKLVGHGEEQLLDRENSHSAENRRVEITTLVTTE